MRVRGVNSIAKIFNNDSNDFIQLDANDESFRYFANDTEVFSVLANGNVGIGTSSPSRKLDVLGIAKMNDIHGRGDQRFAVFPTGSSTTSRSYLELFGNEAGRVGEARLAGTYVSLVTASTTSVVGSERVRISSNGNVGIGTTTPQRKLDVNGDADIRGVLRLNNNTDGFAWTLGVTGQSILRGKLRITQPDFLITNASNDLELTYEGNSEDNLWRIMHTSSFLSFIYDDDRKSYIEQDGDYIKDSDRSLKANIRPIGNILDKVIKLNPVPQVSLK